MSNEVRVNVGSIGHVDHGRTTITQALARVLGEEMASQVVVVDSGQVESDSLRRLADVEIVTPRNERYWSKRRKKERKARLAELQRKAFEGGRRP